MTITYLSCKFLPHQSAAVLMQALVAADDADDLTLLPIWLNNDGQQVIGLWPAMALTVHHTAVTKQALGNQLTIDQKYRQASSEDNKIFKAACYQTHIQSGTMTSVVETLIAYQHSQQPKAVAASGGYDNGLMGFISYDIAADSLANTQPNAAYLSQDQPLLFIGHYDMYLRHEAGGWQLYATSDDARTRLCAVYAWLEQLTAPQPKQAQDAPSGITLQPRWTQAQYQQAFHQVQRYLKAGDCYQINLTQCWHGQLTTSGLVAEHGQDPSIRHKLVSYLPALYASTHAPFAGYVKVAHYELLSCSPELFFTFTHNDADENTIITKPIKGTRPRGNTALDDDRLKHQLADSDKDKAENVMIVDLLRNDLGKYAKTGTVQVPQLFAIESFSNVHHMVSTITATLKDDVHPLHVLFDSLPAGSITGTPKKRAVEIIQELEVQPRGAYCGSLGYLNFDGTGQWNVLIRTLQAVDDQVSLWAGGGVTIASDCEAEYQECFDKVGNLLAILQAPTTTDKLD